MTRPINSRTLILTSLLSSLAFTLAFIFSASSLAQTGNDTRADYVLVDMAAAFKKLDKKRLSELLPQASGHSLEPWAAYWELKARLEEVSDAEVQRFLARYVGTYQEDRLRNDWLMLLGQRRDWGNFAFQYPHYRMRDDKEVRCYALLVDHLQTPQSTGALTGETPLERAAEVRKLWWSLKDADDGCNLAADRLIKDPNIAQNPAQTGMNAQDAFIKARMATEVNRARAARNALQIVMGSKNSRSEESLLDILRTAAGNADSAADELRRKMAQFNAEQTNWAWGAIGKQAALSQNSNAASYFANVSKDSDLNDDTLGWKVRATLRVSSKPNWTAVLNAINAMSEPAQKDAIWTYWKARALKSKFESKSESKSESKHLLPEANALFERIASVRGFYEQLALEELGRKITVPERPPEVTTLEKAAARQNAGLNRALKAISIGLRSEGVREWNYSTNLTNSAGQVGGMNDRELLAAAQYACEREVWDRCINTSERTKTVIDFDQRFPMPHQKSVVKRAGDIGLDPAYVYGLIRQESRFIMDARSGVGAAGLMQVMPATARWTAKKIGLTNFTADQINDRDTNIAIGTGYLKLVLDDFAGSMPLAAAAYNAGPNRPRAWRNGAVVETAIWAENVPFAETRDYVKKVLSNTTNYAAILTGQPQSLKNRLGMVGPLGVDAPAVNTELP
jgi:soluble lytic murein transglycosylase